MAFPLYELACSACHSLQFDKRFTDEAPHNQPSVVHAFIVKKFTEYIAAHPASCASRATPIEMSGRPCRREFACSPRWEWVASKRLRREELLVAQDLCKQCIRWSVGHRSVARDSSGQFQDSWMAFPIGASKFTESGCRMRSSITPPTLASRA